MSNRISQYWPAFYLKIKDFEELSDTEAIEFTDLDNSLQQVFDDAFVLTSDEKAIARREKELGIQADPDNESLDFRRQRILNRYQTHPPFTVRWLQRQLDRLLGEGMTIVSVDYPNRILYVTTNIDDAHLFNEVEHTIHTVKPANMTYQQRTSVEDIIGLEEHIKKQDIHWNYTLDGNWKLGEKPFATLGAEVVIK